MDVNGITNNINSYSTYENTTKVTKEAAAEVATTENGVVYEPSGKTDNKTVKVDAEFIAKRVKLHLEVGIHPDS